MSNDDQGIPILGPTAPVPIGKKYVPESIRPRKPKKEKRQRGPIRALGWPVVIILFAIAVDADFSLWGWGTITPLGYMAVRRGWARLIEGPLLIAILLTIRVFTLREGPTVSVRTMPSGQTARVVNRLAEEGDLSGLAAAWLPRLGAFPADENTSQFSDRMNGLYSRLRSAEGSLASTVPATWLGKQSPEAFDLITVRHAAIRTAADNMPVHRQAHSHAVLFLHGSAGSSMGLCWALALSAKEVGMTTYCPSVGPDAAWASAEGLETIAITRRLMTEEGASSFHLVGLSGGAAAACSLVAGLTEKPTSMVLISGAAPEGTTGGVPTLLIHGTNDAMMPVSLARNFAEREPTAELLELEAGHFALIDQPETISNRLVGFWREHPGE